MTILYKESQKSKEHAFHMRSQVEKIYSFILSIEIDCRNSNQVVWLRRRGNSLPKFIHPSDTKLAHRVLHPLGLPTWFRVVLS